MWPARRRAGRGEDDGVAVFLLGPQVGRSVRPDDAVSPLRDVAGRAVTAHQAHQDAHPGATGAEVASAAHGGRRGGAVGGAAFFDLADGGEPG
jgi:hypothetical protein